MLAPPAQKEPTLASDDADTAPTIGELPRDFGPYELLREIGALDDGPGDDDDAR